MPTKMKNGSRFVVCAFLLVTTNVNNYLNNNLVSCAGIGIQENDLTVIPKCCEFGFTLELELIPRENEGLLSASSKISISMGTEVEQKIKKGIKCVAKDLATPPKPAKVGGMELINEEGDDSDSGSWTIPSVISSSFSSFNVTFDVHRPACHHHPLHSYESEESEEEFELHWIRWNETEKKDSAFYVDNDTVENETLNYEDEMNFGSTITPEGYFAPEAANPIYYPPTMYCMERMNSTSIAIKLCARTVADFKQVPDCSNFTGKNKRKHDGIPCLRKCCPMGQMVAKERNGCVPTTQRWQLPPQCLHNDNKHKDANKEEPPSPTALNKIVNDTEKWQMQPIVILRSPATFCVGENEPPLSWTSNDQEFKIIKNGDVVFKSSTSGQWKNVSDERPFYCLDNVDTSLPPSPSQRQNQYQLDRNDSDPEIMMNLDMYDNDDFSNYSPSSSDLHILFFCGKSQDSKSVLFSSIYGSVMLGSSLFLLIAATINFLLWKKQNVHNWTVQAYIISLFCMYVFLGISHIISQNYKTSTGGVSMEICTFIGGAAHYFFLSTFCWLFMINFDLWWKFRKLTATSIQSQRARKQRFCLYVIFTTGVPAVVVSAGECIQRFYNSKVDMNNWLITPNYGKSVCYMEENAGWPYLYGPICTLLAFNLAFFISTIYSLYQIRKMTKIVTEGNHKNKEDQKYFRVKLFGKLFCIMGILWNFEVISFAVESKGESSWSWYWLITDMLNIFQAVAIFYIFTWKRHVKTSLETQYPLFKTFFAMIRQAEELLRMRAPKSQDPPTDSEAAAASNSNTSNTSNIDRKRSMTSNISITTGYAT